MKKILILICLFSLLILSSHGQGNSTFPKNSRMELFNGENLDGWYTYIKDRGKNTDPKNVFIVSNGLIRISGEEFGCITTIEEFENYRLLVEFMWGDETFDPRSDKARDSGILLHSVGEDGGSDRTWMHSIECQIIEGGTGDFIVVGDGTRDFMVTCPVAPVKQGNSYVFKPRGDTVTINSGRINWYGRDPGWEDVLGFRGKRDVEKKPGKWNRIECIVKGEDIKIYLNGRLVNHAVNSWPRKGKIQIQSEGAEIFFRKITLIPLHNIR